MLFGPRRKTKSSGWLQAGAGDKKTAESSCVQASFPNLTIWNTTVSQPGGNSVSCPNCCYQSWGITQNKLFYEPTAFPMAVDSTAFTLDLTYATIRACMNGDNANPILVARDNVAEHLCRKHRGWQYQWAAQSSGAASAITSQAAGMILGAPHYIAAGAGDSRGAELQP